MISLKTTVFTALIMCLAAGASAQSASSFTFTVGHVVNQTSATTTSNRGYYYDFKIDGVNPSQYNYGDIGTQSWQGDGFYPTTVLLDSNFHAKTGLHYDRWDLDSNYWGGFWFNLGNDGVVDEAVSLYPGADRFSNTPLLSQFDDLQNLSAGQSFTVNVPGFTPNAGTDESSTSYYLQDYTSGTTSLSGMSAGAGAFNFTIPTNTLVADHTYGLRVVYSNRIATLDAGFGGATSYETYSNELVNEFYVVPEPTTIAALSLGLVAVLRRRKKA